MTQLDEVGGTTRTGAPSEAWHPVCSATRLGPGRAFKAVLDGVPVAVKRTPAGGVAAVSAAGPWPARVRDGMVELHRPAVTPAPRRPLG